MALLQNPNIPPEENNINIEDGDTSPEECTKLLKDTFQDNKVDVFIELQILKEDKLENSAANLISCDILEKPDNYMECRICRCKDEEPLINPCKCSGSSKWIHQSCLVQWFQVSRTTRCELCSEKITIKKYTKPICEWKRPKVGFGPCNKVDLWYLFVTLFSLGTIVGFAIFQGCIGADESTETLVVFTAIYVLCAIMILVRIRYFYHWFTRRSTYWNTWRGLNQNWVIKTAESLRVAEEGAVISTTTERISFE